MESHFLVMLMLTSEMLTSTKALRSIQSADMRMGKKVNMLSISNVLLYNNLT